MKNEYRAALDRGRQENKLVLVTFTGYACTNCHWMKANMFPRPEIADVAKDLVLVELYTDGTDAASEENAKLEDTKFASVSTPLFVLLDEHENVLATSGYTRDTAGVSGISQNAFEGMTAPLSSALSWRRAVYAQAPAAAPIRGFPPEPMESPA